MRSLYEIKLVILSVVVGLVTGGGYVDVFLSHYTNSHGLDWDGAACDYHDSGCDHYAVYCLTDHNANSECLYSGYTTTPHAENTFWFAIDRTSRYHFTEYPGSFALRTKIYDDDHPFTDDRVDEILARTILAPGHSSGLVTYNGRRGGLNVNFSAACNPDYYGSRCNVFCQAMNDSGGHYTCGSNGEKICLEGWTEPFYNCIQAVCNSPCVHGSCVAPNTCSCNAQYEGELCGEAICKEGCLNGYCDEPGECICFGGYSGDLCEDDHRYCQNNSPCLNNGTCTNTGPNTYSCECPYGYNGTDCESTYDVCSVEGFCMYGGTCTSFGVPGEFFCDCVSGSSGDRCEVLDDSCAKANCRNGGTCINLLNNFTCECVPGTTGEFCQVNIDDCRSSPCQNGGVCIDEIDDFLCVCQPNLLEGDVLKTCEGKPCDYHLCQNGGTCKEYDRGEAVCVCNSFFAGEYCEWNKSRLSDLENTANTKEEGLTTNVIIAIALGGGLVAIAICVICLGILACICCGCCRRDGARYTLDNKYEDKEYKVDDGGDVTFADNPEYGTTKLHIYDEVRHRPGPNPYEDVTLGNDYQSLKGVHYGNSLPSNKSSSHQYPKVTKEPKDPGKEPHYEMAEIKKPPSSGASDQTHYKTPNSQALYNTPKNHIHYDTPKNLSHNDANTE